MTNSASRKAAESDSLSRLRANSSATLVGMGLRFVGSLAATPVLIRSLGLERYGLWALANAALSLGLLAEFGLTSAFTVRLAAVRGDSKQEAEAISTSFGLICLAGTAGVTAGLLVLSLFPAALGLQPGDLDCNAGFRILVLAIGSRLIQQWLVAWEAGVENYRLQSLVETGHVIVMNGGFVAVALSGGRIRALAAWLLVSSVAACITHFSLLRRMGHLPERFRIAMSASTARSILGFGWRHWLANLGGALFTRGDRLIVNASLGPHAVGIYAAATAVVTKINEVSAMPIQPLTPAISNALSNQDLASARSMFWAASERNALFVHLLGSTTFVFAESIAWLLAGNGSAQLAGMIRVLSLVYSAYSLVGVGHYTMLGLGRPGANAAVVLAASASSLSAIYLGARVWGLWGVAWGNSPFCILWITNFIAAAGIGIPARTVVRRYAFLFSLLLVGVALTFSGGPESTHLPGPFSHIAPTILVWLALMAGSPLVAPNEVRSAAHWAKSFLSLRAQQ